MQQDTRQCNLCASQILARCFDIHTRACSKKFSKSAVKKQTKTDPNNLIPCTECGEMVDFGVFSIHMEECVGRQLAKCVNCKLLFPTFLIEDHNAVCNIFKEESFEEEILEIEMSDDEEDEDLRQMIRNLAKINSKDNQQPLSLSTINSLKKIVVPQSEECSICYCQITKSSAIIQLKCPHKYHSRCLTTWLQKNPQCPMCRRHALY